MIACVYCFSNSIQAVEVNHSDHNRSHVHDVKTETAFELPVLHAENKVVQIKAPQEEVHKVPSLVNQSETLRLSDYKGKVVYIDFWASWCTPCLVSMPLLNDLRNKYHAEGFEVIAINLDKNPSLAAKFMEDMNIDYPVVSDIYGTIGKQYKVNGLPTAYIIDANGKVQLIHQGFKKSDINFIEAIVSKLIDEI